MFISYTMPPPFFSCTFAARSLFFSFFVIWNPVNHKLQRARNELSAVTLFFFFKSRVQRKAGVVCQSKNKKNKKINILCVNER